MFFIDKLKEVFGLSLPNMNPAQSFAASGNQDILNCEANIAFIEYLWDNGKDGVDVNTITDPIRAEYQRLFTCISRCHKIRKKLVKETKFLLELIMCKELRSIPDMTELIENVSRRIPLTHPIPYMWNHDEQWEIIGNLNMKWEELVLQHYLTSFPVDDEDSDNDVSFDEKYGIVKTELSDMAMKSVGTEFLRQCASKVNNDRLRNEVLAVDREERIVHRQMEEEFTELLSSWKPPRDTNIPVVTPCVRRSSTPASLKLL